MVDAKKELGQIAKSLSVLTKKTEKLAKQIGKLEKGPVPKKQRRSVKPKKKTVRKPRTVKINEKKLWLPKRIP